MRLASLIAFCALMFTGCAWFRSGTTPNGAPAKNAKQAAPPRANPDKKGLIVTPAGTAAGKVVSVNGQARYVVLNFPIGQVPPLGARLGIYHGGLKAGEAKVTGPQRDNNTIADVVTGEARIGDEARVE